MIRICPKCQNYKWDKEVVNDTIRCPKCGMTWQFKKRPLYILAGWSGVGKTSTGMALQKMSQEFVVLDSDIFYNIMAHETEEDEYERVEQIQSLSSNISQAGKSVVWTMAGNIDKLNKTYSSRFFSEIKVLALTCTSTELRRRMTEGRGISDEEWLKGSSDYNEYLRTHTKLDETEFDSIDITNFTPEEAANKVLAWLHN